MVLHHELFFCSISDLKQILCIYAIGSKIFFPVYEKLVALKDLLSSVINKGYVIIPCVTSLN